MFKNYLKIALRTLVHNKLYTTLNVAGLTFGITCFLLIGLYVFDELTFDEQHTRGNRIYRVVEHKNVNGEVTTIAAAGFKLAEESKKRIPEVENATRMQRTGRANLVNPENPVNFQETVTVADENFLKIFDFPLVVGDRNTALKEPNSIIINVDLAIRLFGKTDVLGKLLTFSHLDAPLKITGILENHPRNSSFDFNSVMSESSYYNSEFFKNAHASDWASTDFSVYLLLGPQAEAGLVSGKLSRMVLDNFKPEPGTSLSYSLQPLKDLHLNSKGIVDGARNSNVEAIAQGSPLYLKIFSFIALFVIVIAGINYVNLTTARASGRLKEIGVRKTIGAFKSNLIRQFLLESLLVTVISFILALAVVNLLLPAYNQFVNKELSLGLSTDYRIWLYAIGSVTLIGLLSGSYPALMLSRHKPSLLLKGMKLNNRGGLSLRKGLVVLQFTISIVMITATIVLFQQVRYLNNTDLGFNKELLVVVDVNTGKARSSFETIKAEMAKIPSVKSVSVTSRVPGEWKTYRMVKLKNNGSTGEPVISYLFGADKDFMSTYEIGMVKGRNFDTPADSGNVIINETAAKMLGITEAAGQLLEIPAVSRESEFRQLNEPFRPRLIGIVKDFHFQTLRSKIEPLVLAYNQNPIHNIDYYTARISPDNIQATLDKMKAIMVAVDEREPFEYHFLNEQLARFYLEDHRRQTLLIWVALATIFIACMGLFGLATYAAEQRVKEIGVRKVLGATVFGLTSLLSKDFLKLVLIAIFIAFPIAYWGTSRWLQEYAYHIDLQWWVFVLSGLLAIIIALATVSFQAIKAALANPVKSLRTE